MALLNYEKKMSHPDPTKENWIECEECGGQEWIE